MKKTNDFCRFRFSSLRHGRLSYHIKRALLLIFLIGVICCLAGCAPSTITIPLLADSGNGKISILRWDVEKNTLSQPEALYTPASDTRFPLFWDGGDNYIFDQKPNVEPGKAMTVTIENFLPAETLVAGNLQIRDNGNTYLSVQFGKENYIPRPSYASDYELCYATLNGNNPIFVYRPTDGVLRYAVYDPSTLSYQLKEVSLPEEYRERTLAMADHMYAVGDDLYLSGGDALLKVKFSDGSITIQKLEEQYHIPADTVEIVGGYGDILILWGGDTYYAVQNGALLAGITLENSRAVLLDGELKQQEEFQNLLSISFPWQTLYHT